MLNSRKDVGVASLVFGLALGVVGSIGSSSAIADRPTASKHVVLCHATGSERTPYVRLKVSQNAVNGSNKDGNGDHLNHTGPVWYPGAKADGVDWGDIIPPVDGVNDGLNWPEGEAIFDNDCEKPATGVSPQGGSVPQSDGLPATGRDSSDLLLLGGVSVVLGALLLSLTRKSAIR